MLDIVSIGAATVDIFVKSDHFKSDSDHNIGLCLPYSSKGEIQQSLICSGGGATNTSTSFSRHKLKSACISRVGNDYFYPIIAQELKKEKVTNLLSLHPKEKTDFSIIIVADDGSRTVLTNRGDTQLDSNDIDWSTLANVKWIHVTSLEGNLDLLEQIIGFAYEHKIKISINPGNRELSKSKVLIPLLKFVDFLLLNTTESETLLQRKFNEGDFIDEIINFGPKIVSITDGRNGAYVASSRQRLYSPIINTNPIDETGAGDSFGAAFIAAQIYQQDLHQSLNWAIHNSASVVSHLGSKPGILTYQQIAKKY